MAERFDVVVVGARCAGSPLATHLAGAGLSVAVLDRATFPSDTPSTHIFQAEGVACLGRLGVLDRVVATGAPWIGRAALRLGDVSVTVPWPTRPGDPGPQLCVRRPLLDTILLDRAREAGAEVRLATKVTGLVVRGARVAGVRAVHRGRNLELHAPLVVGADGRGSIVARRAGARRYHVVPNQRFAYWAYYEGAAWEEPATMIIQRWDEEFVLSCPTDGGLYLVITYPPLSRLDEFRRDVDAAFDAAVAACPPVAEVVGGARPVARPAGMVSYEAYLRESAGPGWVLVGDAGHFKDPAPGQGISDALRQADRLAPVVASGIGGPPPELDQALRRWWRWRDRDAFEMHWFATDMGAAGGVPRVLATIVRARLRHPDGARQLFDVFNHRVAPSEVLTPARLAAATGRLLRDARNPRGEVLAEVRDIVREDLRRRWRNHRPQLAAAG